MNKASGSEHWIFLRGLTRGEGHWGNFPETFRQRFPRAEIEFLDLPGCGIRHLESSHWSMKKNLEAVREKCQSIRGGKKVNLLSISLGSMLATLWQDIYPGEVERMILINTSFRGLPASKRFNLAQALKFLKVPFAKSALEKEEIITRIVCNNEENRARNVPILAAFSEKYPVKVGNFIRQLYSASSADFPAAPKRPTLILTCKTDRLVSYECSLKLAEKWKLPVSIHPLAGHDLPIDDPQWLLEQLEKNTSA